MKWLYDETKVGWFVVLDGCNKSVESNTTN